MVGSVVIEGGVDGEADGEAEGLLFAQHRL